MCTGVVRCEVVYPFSEGGGQTLSSSGELIPDLTCFLTPGLVKSSLGRLRMSYAKAFWSPGGLLALSASSSGNQTPNNFFGARIIKISCFLNPLDGASLVEEVLQRSEEEIRKNIDSF